MNEYSSVRTHPIAEVSPGASIGPGTSIWNQAQVPEGARIGEGCVIGQNAHVDAVIGDNTKIRLHCSRHALR